MTYLKYRLPFLLSILALCALFSSSASSQTPSTYTPPRTADGQPDLQGVWRVWNLAKYDVEPHNASEGVPAGMGVVVDPPDGMIPYQPWARAKKNENFEKSRITYPYDPLKNADPSARCYLPGVPRITYMGFPFMIFQTKDLVGFQYEWDHGARYVPLPSLKRPLLDAEWQFFNGVSRGRFEGNSLVVEVTNLNDHTWLDMAGNFSSRTAKVVERYTPTGPDAMDYEATIEDPRVYTRPWKMRMQLQRQRDPLLEYECVALLEESGVHITWERDWDQHTIEPPAR